MNENLEIKLQSWLDGELSPREARRMTDLLRTDAQAAAVVAELQSARDAMLHNEMQRAVPETREFYWSKIEAQIEREGKRRYSVYVPWFERWQRYLVPLTGVIGVLAIFLIARPFSPASAPFDEISATGEGMEAVTFHDQSAGMTVVWLQESQPATTTEKTATDEDANSDVEME